MPNQHGTEEGLSDVFVLQVVLIAVSVLLGAVLTALIVFFTVRERSLSRQLKALSTTGYEPEEGHTKRVEPPNTNVFSEKGVNGDLHGPQSQLSTVGGAYEGDRQSVVFDNLRFVQLFGIRRPCSALIRWTGVFQFDIGQFAE